jgi:hypothetical protein
MIEEPKQKRKRGNPGFGTIWKGGPHGEVALKRRREIRFSEEMDDKLSTIASVEGKTVAQLVREIVEEYLKE